MKNIFKTFLISATLFVVLIGQMAFAETFTYQSVGLNPYQQAQAPVFQTSPVYYSNNLDAERIQQLLVVLTSLQAQLVQLQQNQGMFSNINQNTNPYTFNQPNQYFPNTNQSNREPDVTTQRARSISSNSAELEGEVDMRDYRNGLVFFVYGQDEDAIDDVEDDYDEYDDVEDDEDTDDFMVIRVDRNLDGDDEYSEDVFNLDFDERYYFVLCVEYEDDDRDEVLECGSVRDFRTD